MGMLSNIAKALFPPRELCLISEAECAVTTDRLVDVLNKASAKDVQVFVGKLPDNKKRIQALAMLRPDSIGYIRSNGFTVRTVTSELAPNQP